MCVCVCVCVYVCMWHLKSSTYTFESEVPKNILLRSQRRFLCIPLVSQNISILSLLPFGYYLDQRFPTSSLAFLLAAYFHKLYPSYKLPHSSKRSINFTTFDLYLVLTANGCAFFRHIIFFRVSLVRTPGWESLTQTNVFDVQVNVHRDKFL